MVLSASPHELVEAVAAELGAHRGIGTRMEVADGRLTGRLDGPFCHGPRSSSDSAPTSAPST